MVVRPGPWDSPAVISFNDMWLLGYAGPRPQGSQRFCRHIYDRGQTTRKNVAVRSVPFMTERASSLCARIRALHLRREQRGQSLVELLIASALSVVVLGAIGTLLVASQRQQQKNANYDNAQGNAQAELDKMVGQIRDAQDIISWSANSVDMDVDVGSTEYQVYWECDVSAGNGWDKCVRLQTTVNGPLPALSTATTIIPYLTNGTSVFTWTTETTAPGSTTSPNLAPDYVTATIDVPASNGVTSGHLSINRTIAFSEGALIRNLDVEN